jgi:putative PIN family toxin of toxin-antitoxin system
VVERKRAVLDSNVVVDALLGRRRAAVQVIRALFEGRFDAFATAEVAAEYHLALHSRSVRAAAEQVGLSVGWILDYEQAITEAITSVEPGPSFRCADPDDDKFTAASSGAHADYLVTSDAELLAMGTVLEASIVTPELFVEQLGK